MKHTAYLSAISMNARKRHVIVFTILFAWLSLLLTCPNIMDDTSHSASAEVEHVSHAAAGSTHDGSHDEACCTPAPHAAVASAQKFDLTTYFILISVLPAIVTSLMALVAMTSNRSFIRSPRSTWTRHSPFFWTLWPQAPPR